jgi:tetratricopeptide (TPR) repeat protein
MSDPIGADAEQRASALLQMGRPAEAAVVLKQALGHDPGHWKAAVLLSTAELRQGNNEAAIAAAQQAVALAPQQEWAYRVLSVAYTRSKRGDEARQAATMAVQLAPRQYQGYVVLVSALLQVRDRAGARTAAEQAIALNPQSATPFIQMSTAAHAAEDWELMELACKNALAREPENVIALNNLGCALLRQHRGPEAVPVYELAARLDPTFEPVKRTLYRLSTKLWAQPLLSDETRRLMEAERHARRFSIRRWDWHKLVRLRPWWWRAFEALPPVLALPLHIAALCGCLAAIAANPRNGAPVVFILIGIWLALMLPRSVYRLQIWWSVRHPEKGSWAHTEGLAATPIDSE